MGDLIFKRLDKWYDSALGSQLLAAEQQIIATVLPQIFGYHLLQIAGPGDGCLIKTSNINHRVRFSTAVAEEFPGASILGQLDDLPFLPKSLDLIVVPHVLGFIPKKQQQQFLSDLYHMLIPGGSLILLGFNRKSLWGLRKLLSSGSSLPWSARFYSGRFVRRQLQRLGFTISSYKTVFFRPPLTEPSKLQRTLFFEAMGQMCWPNCGASYMIVAKKEAVPLNPVKKRWRRRRVEVNSGYPEPSTRTHT